MSAIDTADSKVKPQAGTSLPEHSINAPVVDPVRAARTAHLHYVRDNGDGPCIRRKRAGKGFSYRDEHGQSIHDKQVLARIQALGIPPAWTDVWISPDPNAHIQATGRDAKGRKQYRYHARWKEVRNETKFSRMVGFGQALPAIRAQVESDLAQQGLPRTKVLALVVRLLEMTLIRVGNEEYAQSNHSFGLTTLRDRHVEVFGSTVRFKFRGKSGKDHSISVKDKRLAALVKRCKDVPGYELFQYIDEDGSHQSISSTDVNDYLRTISGQEFSAKDFRTWGGTVLSVLAFRELGLCEDETQVRKHITQAVRSVAAQLGNTPAICQKYYLHPAMIEAYRDGTLFKTLNAMSNVEATENGLRSEETVVMSILTRP